MVDHLSVRPAGVAVVWSFGFPSLEGRIREADSPSPGPINTNNTTSPVF